MRAHMEHILDPKVLRIIRVFLRSNKLFHLQTISSESKVPMGSTHRLMPKIVKTGLVDVLTVGKSKLYRTNAKVAKEMGMLK